MADLIEVTGPDNAGTGFLDPDAILSINPFMDKGAVMLGMCVVLFKVPGLPPMLLKESASALAERINAARRGTKVLL